MNAVSEWLRHAILFRNKSIARLRQLELEQECRCFCEPGEPGHDIADHLV